MAVEAVIYQLDAHTRSGVVCAAMAKGIAACGDTPILRRERDYRGPEAQIAVFYGFDAASNLPKVMQDYAAVGSAVYADLGYWGRREGGRWTGYHKLSVNDRHPTAYFQRRAHDSARAKALGVEIRPWRDSGSHILLCGMGDKGAVAEGYRPEEWERQAIETIRKYTDRSIVYRPKPSWKDARPIKGTGFSSRDLPIEQALRSAWCVVTHHSNAAVDAIASGIPAFCWKGVAVPMALQDLALIEEPYRPDGREQWVADIAHTQFSIKEMEAGIAWKHLKAEGLV